MKTLFATVVLSIIPAMGQWSPVWSQVPELPAVEAPITQEFPAAITVPQNQAPLDDAGMKRARALIPLLSGNAEFFAMGEFNHLGKPVIPVLLEALKHPDARVRRNALEVLGMMPDPAAVPALLEQAGSPEEMGSVRVKALRLAAAIDPTSSIDTVLALVQNENSSIKMEAARAAARMKDKRIVSAMIGLLQDQEAFIAVSAINALWRLTRHPSEDHDWAYSRPHERLEWSQEWIEWWKSEGEHFEFPADPKK